MGGKSRKSGGVSKALINKIMGNKAKVSGANDGCCKTKKKKPVASLFDNDEEQSDSS